MGSLEEVKNVLHVLFYLRISQNVTNYLHHLLIVSWSVDLHDLLEQELLGKHLVKSIRSFNFIIKIEVIVDNSEISHYLLLEEFGLSFTIGGESI